MKCILLALIGYYQRCISPYKGGACCIYTPTCSEYARQAIVTHGAIKGAMLAIWRIMRCNPFSKGGYDPVPEKKKKVGK